MHRHNWTGLLLSLGEHWRQFIVGWSVYTARARERGRAGTSQRAVKGSHVVGCVVPVRHNRIWEGRGNLGECEKQVAFFFLTAQPSVRHARVAATHVQDPVRISTQSQSVSACEGERAAAAAAEEEEEVRGEGRGGEGDAAVKRWGL